MRIESAKAQLIFLPVSIAGFPESHLLLHAPYTFSRQQLSFSVMSSFFFSKAMVVRGELCREQGRLATSFELMNESSAAAALSPNELTICRVLLSQQTLHPASKSPPHNLTAPLFSPPLQFKFCWPGSHKSYILSKFHRPRGSRCVPVCDAPELPGATDGRGRTNNNRRMRAFPTTPLADSPPTIP